MKIKFIQFIGALVGLGVSLVPSARAFPTTDSATYNPGLVIPDNDLNGVANTQNFNSTIQSITDVSVTLNISGSYDGDIYAYLTHGTTGFAVLLNRVGVTSTDPFGSSDTGFSVTLDDSAATDIHEAPATGGTLTGTWQPDGRNISPDDSLDTTPRTALLDSFDGMSASGDWTLFLSDDSPVGIGTLDSWTLTVSGDSNTVPETGNTFVLFIAAGGILFALDRRKRQAGSRAE